MVCLTCLFQIVAEKQRFKKNPHNYAVKKTQLMKSRVSHNTVECFN